MTLSTGRSDQRTIRIIALCLAVSLPVLGGCSKLRDEVGLTKRSPDEFTVVTKAPLVLPPDFTLRPPRPGAERPNEQAATDRARAAVVGTTSSQRATVDRSSSSARSALTASASQPARSGSAEPRASEMALLTRAGAVGANSEIREVVNRETTQLAEKDKSFTDKLIFWQDKPDFGTTIDAEKEAQRLRESAAKGEKASTSEVPVIERRSRGILEGILN